MQEIKYSSEFFNAKDTLECGQVFRFKEYKKGYKLVSKDKCCYLYTEGDTTHVLSDDADYFYNYFDLGRDYSEIYSSVLSFNDEFLSKATNLGKGVRILKQDLEETAFSFIVSQNNNISRIKGILEKLATALGEKKYFDGEEYYSFPTAESLAKKDTPFYRELGLGYRDEYISRFAKSITSGLDLTSFNLLETEKLTKELLKIHGIGKKVADCITFFGYGRSDSFPVDTWIEKLYFENFNGKEKDRIKISKELVSKFGSLSGYVQQYVFYYKRSLEK